MSRNEILAKKPDYLLEATGLKKPLVMLSL